MRHELLYTTDQGYLPDTIASAGVYGGDARQVFGRGDGSVDWSGSAGTIEWTNFPQQRPDGVFMPDITGVIRLDGHEHPVMYRMHGISLLPDDSGTRIFAGPVRWYTENPNYVELNDGWGYEEGAIDVETLRFRTRVYILYPDSPI